MQSDPSQAPDRFNPGDAVLICVSDAAGTVHRTPGIVSNARVWRILNTPEGRKRAYAYAVETSLKTYGVVEADLVPARVGIVTQAARWMDADAAWRPRDYRKFV